MGSPVEFYYYGYGHHPKSCLAVTFLWPEFVRPKQVAVLIDSKKKLWNLFTGPEIAALIPSIKFNKPPGQLKTATTPDRIQVMSCTGWPESKARELVRAALESTDPGELKSAILAHESNRRYVRDRNLTDRDRYMQQQIRSGGLMNDPRLRYDYSKGE